MNSGCGRVELEGAAAAGTESLPQIAAQGSRDGPPGTSVDGKHATRSRIVERLLVEEIYQLEQIAFKAICMS